MLRKYLRQIQDDNIGVIVNMFSKQFLNRLYNIYQVPPSNYVEYITLNNIKTIFIDNEIYETDHRWYRREINGLIAFTKLNNIKIIVIKNTDKKTNNFYMDYSLINLTVNDLINENDQRINLPIIVDEKKYNPIDSTKTLDILYLDSKPILRPLEIQSLHKNLNPNRKEIVLEDFSQKNIQKLLETIKTTKVLYIYNPERFDSYFLKFLEITAVLQGTVVYYCSNEITSNIALVAEDLSILSKLVVILKSNLMRERDLLKTQRRVFLNHTFLKFGKLTKFDDNNTETVKISVITSTNRKQNLPDYIETLNGQNLVELQVTLITHGFELTADEVKELKSKLNDNIELNIKYIESEAPLGLCLNTAIKHAKYEYIAKMDDDDFYFKNYLIDSWIASQYSDADLVGKLATHTYLKNSKIIILRHQNTNRTYNNFVMGATFFAKRELMRKYMFSYLSKGEDSDFLRRINEDDAIIYADHPYNFCIYRSGNAEDHTWKITDLDYMRGSEIVSFDSPEHLLSF